MKENDFIIEDCTKKEPLPDPPKPKKPKYSIPLVLALILSISTNIFLFTTQESRVRAAEHDAAYWKNRYDTVVYLLESYEQKYDDLISSPAVENEHTDHSVFVTPLGSKYHRQECHHLKGKSCKSYSIEDAKQYGYSHCKDCNPQ